MTEVALKGNSVVLVVEDSAEETNAEEEEEAMYQNPKGIGIENEKSGVRNACSLMHYYLYISRSKYMFLDFFFFKNQSNQYDLGYREIHFDVKN